MEAGRRIGSFLNKYRSFLLAEFILVYCVVVVGILPIKESLTPQVSQMEGVLYVGEGISEPEQGIVFSGENLDNVDAVYIDRVKNDKCQIISASTSRVVVDIPEEIYREKECFEIQFSKKQGGIFVFKGRSYQVQVSGYFGDRPEISRVSKEVISRSQGSQRILLKVKNCEEGTRLYINEKDTGEVKCLNDDCVEIYLDRDQYSEKDEVEFKLGIELSTTQSLYGDVVRVKVEDADYGQMKCSYDLAEENRLIMHAAYTWNGYTCINCMEAFQENYEKGCKAFEIDWMVTSDGVLVGHYDWAALLCESAQGAEDELGLEPYKMNNLPKTYEELSNMYKDKTPLTWADMMDYLESDDKLYVVTDTKYSNEKAVRYAFGKMAEEAIQQGREGILERVAVQIYDQDMYQAVMDVYPFSSIIYTLDQSPDDNNAVLEFVDNSNVRIIALPKGTTRDDDDFFRKLAEKECYIYVHTINDLEQAAEYMARGCSGIYTDIITPELLPELEVKIMEAKQKIEMEASEAEPELTAEELEANKEYLLNYLQEIKNEDYLVLMCVQDEATESVDDEIAEALTALGISEDYRNAFRQGYIGIMSDGKNIYEAFSDELLEYVYIEDDNVFRLKSAGNGVAGFAGISVNGSKEDDIVRRGLHITVFNRKLGIIQDRIVFDLYKGWKHTNI